MSSLPYTAAKSGSHVALADGESGVKVGPATSLASWVTLGRSLDSRSADTFTGKMEIVSPALPTT